jgi:hypothetical protein
MEGLLEKQVEGRIGGWIQLASGGRIHPLDPRPNEIYIEDIAHALSNLCRYGGHSKFHYCPIPTERILTANLEWVPAGELKVGDELVGFDEYPWEIGMAGNRRRRIRPSMVTYAEPVKRLTYKIKMEDGSTVASSSEHPWLVATKRSRNQSWQTTEALAQAVSRGQKRYMHKFIGTWGPDTSYSAGWLAGIYDGEGYVSMANRTGTQMAVAQNPGLILDKLTIEHDIREFKVGRSENMANSQVISLQMKGGWREIARLLGSIRPIRLLDKFRQELLRGNFAKHLDGIGTPLQIMEVQSMGEAWCSGLSTSTKTYICEGFGAHNSVGQHSLIVSQLLEDNYGPEMALYGLLHDASEAYLIDVPRPIKHSLDMAPYREAESRMERVICERFDLSYPMPSEVKWADRVALRNEQRDLMPPPRQEWEDPRIADVWLDRILPMRPEDVRGDFLARFNGLMAHRELTGLIGV